MSGRSCITGPRSRPLLNALGETAKHLANVARRFVDDKANAGDVEAAIAEWRSALSSSVPSPLAEENERLRLVVKNALKWCHGGHGCFPIKGCGLCKPLIEAAFPSVSP